MASESIHVEVCYARPDVQAVVALTVQVGTTALDAVHQSGLVRRFPELVDADQPLSIYGKRVEATQMLEEGDRVEILRPLTADPKEARRKRAASKKVAR